MTSPSTTPAEIVREYGPFEGISEVHGVSFDGEHVWLASGDRLNVLDPNTGRVVRTLEVPARAGTAFDGRHLFQLSGDRILKLDPHTGKVLGSIPAPEHDGNAGLTWAEGSLWVGQYRGRKIYQIDPETGAVLRSLNSNRFVTGVTFVEGELWHGTDGEGESELRRVDPESGRVLARLVMPEGQTVSGLESNGKDLLFAGGGGSGRVRAVRRR